MIFDSDRLKKMGEAVKLPLLLYIGFWILGIIIILIFGKEIFDPFSMISQLAVLVYAGYRTTKNLGLNLGAAGAVGFLVNFLFGIIFSIISFGLSVLTHNPLPDDMTFSIGYLFSLAYYSIFAIIPAFIGGFVGTLAAKKTKPEK